MHKTFYLLLLCAIALLGVASTQAAQTAMLPDSQSGVVTTDPAVARIAYLEDKIANLETTVQNGCNSCADVCCRPRMCSNRGIIGGYDFLWLSPNFSNAISWQHRSIVGPVTVVTSHGYPTDYNMAPRFWLGYKGQNGLGVRVRYEQFDQTLMSASIDSVDATQTVFFDSLSATNGQILSFTTGMEMHVLDIDITKDFKVGCADVTLGAGLRYGKLLFDYGGLVTDAQSTLQFISAGENSFEGIGPTAFIDFKTPIRQSALSVVGGLRGSVLFGRGRDDEYVGRVIDPVAVSMTVEHANRSTGIIDASLGLQYDRCLTRGIDGFIRVAWEGQLWMDVGSPVQSSGDMALQGLCIGFGINR